MTLKQLQETFERYGVTDMRAGIVGGQWCVSLFTVGRVSAIAVCELERPDALFVATLQALNVVTDGECEIV